MSKELAENFSKFMMLMLEKMLKAIERIERKVNECKLCYGYGRRTYNGIELSCEQCNGTGITRKGNDHRGMD